MPKNVDGKWICGDGKECTRLHSELGLPLAYGDGSPACWSLNGNGRLVCCSRLSAKEIEEACEIMAREVRAGRFCLD
jgi:hypothetical protein